MLRIAVEEGLLQDSQCREVQTFDVFFEKEMFELSKVKLKAYLDDIPEETEKWTILEGEESLKVSFTLYLTDVLVIDVYFGRVYK